ncbi:MAG: hypothetical protein P1V20_30780 [Verrucomicrobiales bacterium]|nr:hypothetical protein [Verrucomicrobiales bacterium]
MSNLKSQPYQVWFPGEMVWELWFVDQRKRARLIDTCEDSRLLKFRRGIRKRVLALPAGSQTPLAFTSTAFGESKLLKGAVQFVEKEGLECDLEGIGVQPVCGYPPNTLARVDAPLSGLRPTVYSEKLCPDLIVPAATLLPVPGNDLAIWTEMGKKVLAVEKGGGIIYYRELAGQRNADCAREIRKILPFLKETGVIHKSSALHVWCRNGFDVYKNILTIDVNAGYRTDPVNLRPSLGMRPALFRENDASRLAKKKKRLKRTAVSTITALITFLIAGGYTYSTSEIAKHRERISDLRPEAESLDLIKSQWEEMAPAVDRNASVLETWRNLFAMPGAADVDIRRMAIAKDKVELSCTAKNVTAAFRFIDELAMTAQLGSFSWDYTTPETLKNGTTLFELKGFK